MFVLSKCSPNATNFLIILVFVFRRSKSTKSIIPVTYTFLDIDFLEIETFLTSSLRHPLWVNTDRKTIYLTIPHILSQ